MNEKDRLDSLKKHVNGEPDAPNGPEDVCNEGAEELKEEIRKDVFKNAFEEQEQREAEEERRKAAESLSLFLAIVDGDMY
jgi:hypothetical protein